MRPVLDTCEVTIEVKESELIEGKWINFQLLSRKLGEMEREKKLAYKQLRNRMYNSMNCNKYNIEEKAGLKCFDVDNPMKGTASLKISFVRV